MLRRKISDILAKWKDDPHKKPLLVRGARQVGKTFIIDDFAKKNYGTYIYINFEETASAANIFSGDKDVGSVMLRMSARFKDADFVPGDTLIFLDEIQNCPDARTALKFFAVDGRYDIIASGSLLGVRYKEISSYPVGYEDVIDLYSLDFEEFLWAMGIDDGVIASVKGSLSEKRPIDKFFLDEFNKYFRWYMITGGMPEAVNIFKEKNHFGEVLKVQRRILNGYMDDVSKYVSGNDRNRILAVFRSIPRQLSKINKKFVYADIEGRSDSRYDMYGRSLSWLYDAGIIDFCYNLNEPALPLMFNSRENVFKIYLKDTGLLMAMMEDGIAESLLNDDISVNERAVTENAVADMLGKSGYTLTYFESKGTLEVDFVLNLTGVVTAIEVKSGNNKRAKSLYTVMSKHDVKRGIVLSDTDLFTNHRGIERYPIFTAAFMRSL